MPEKNQLEGLESRSTEICLEVYKHCTATEAAFMSMAISLKRIADALEYHPEGSANLFDLVRVISEKHW